VADFEFYLSGGWITHATLVASSTNNLENLNPYYFTSSKAPNWVWGPPDRELTTLPRRPAYETMLDMSQKSHGLVYWQWGFKYLPLGPLMAFTVRLGLSDTGVSAFPDYMLDSALCTVRTPTYGAWDAANKASYLGYETYQCTALKPIPNEHYKLETGGVRDIIFRFVGGTQVS
jgi:hypothetical protein